MKQTVFKCFHFSLNYIRYSDDTQKRKKNQLNSKKENRIKLKYFLTNYYCQKDSSWYKTINLHAY